jgi:hypothetical protein
VTIFTPDWNASTKTPRPAGSAEWVIDGSNHITAVRKPGAAALGAPVAAGTRVIAFSQHRTAPAAVGKVGDTVKVRMRQSTDTGVKVADAIGRGSVLVDRGVAAPAGCAAYSHSRADRPRTLVGWTQAGTWQTLTVPGKLFADCPPTCLRDGGLALANVAGVAARLGFWQAYELDGGGSTTLYTRGSGGKWSRRDLYGLNTKTGKYQRPVVNALAFMNS